MLDTVLVVTHALLAPSQNVHVQVLKYLVGNKENLQLET
jgi:hypothetical protein